MRNTEGILQRVRFGFENSLTSEELIYNQSESPDISRILIAWDVGLRMGNLRGGVLGSPSSSIRCEQVTGSGNGGYPEIGDFPDIRID
jgi:hypothetical protein